MFGFGHGPELIIIVVIALIVLGPSKIPEVAQMLGKGIRELRQASSDLQKTFDVNELINPTPPPPPPIEASPAPMAAATETILPPAGAPAKPKRTRKRGPSLEAFAAPSPAAAGEGTGEGATSADDHPHPSPLPPAGEGTVAAVRRRPSKKTSEPVSFDALA